MREGCHLDLGLIEGVNLIRISISLSPRGKNVCLPLHNILVVPATLLNRLLVARGKLKVDMANSLAADRKIRSPRAKVNGA
jgi:hypothetical protein